jgi:hypothetical protein
MTSQIDLFVAIAGFSRVITNLHDKDVVHTTQEWMTQLQTRLDEWRPQIAAALAQCEKNQRESSQVLAYGGWVGMERHFTDSQARSAVETCKSKGEAGMNNAIAEYFNTNDCALLSEMTEGWSNVPYLRDRQLIIADAVSAHREGRFTLTVPSLLPLAEGLSVEILGNTGGNQNPVKAVARDWKQRAAEVWAQVFAEVVEDVIYKRYDFRSDPAPYLNRHGILHGRIPDYATRENSTRVFLLTDAIADLWLEKQRTLANVKSSFEAQASAVP